MRAIIDFRRVVGVVLAGAIALCAAACGGDGDGGGGARTSDDEQAIENRIRGSFEAFNAGDFEGWAAGTTDAGLRAIFPGAVGTREGYRAAFAETEGTHYEIISISDLVVEGDRAHVTTASAFSFQGSDPDVHIVNASRGHYVKVDGEWKLDSFESASPAVPAGVAVVPVTADEFSWGFDAAAMKDGKIALRIDNVGEQQHQLDLRRVPDELDLESWVAAAEFTVAEIPIGSTLPFEPGESRVVVFSAPLKPGRYVMSCFVADASAADGSLHIDRGMYREFRVE